MTPETKDKLRAAAEAATPGPWRYQERSDAYTHIVRAGESYFVCQLSQTGKQSEANARFMALANPANVTALIDRIDELSAENERLKKGEWHQASSSDEYVSILKARVHQLETALKPFADQYEEQGLTGIRGDTVRAGISATIGHLRAASEAMEPSS